MQFHIEDDTLTIRFEGMERIWALKRQLVVPKANIARATWDEQLSIPRRELGWRVGGTGLPGVLMAGRFRGFEGLNFVYLQRPHGSLDMVQAENVLTLEMRDYRYQRLVFTINKADMAEQIIAWWSSNS